MRLPYNIRSIINKHIIDHAPIDWDKRKDWLDHDGKWTCDHGRYEIVQDPYYGKVIAENVIVRYNIG